MKDYIERYIFAVQKHLPQAQREEIGSELRTFILEKVQEDDSFSTIEAVLKGLGSPRKLAHSYRDKNRSLIGPDHFELYIDVLKIGLAIFIGINVTIGLLSLLTGLFTEGMSIGRLFEIFFEDVIGSTLSSALTGFALITLGFVAAIHFNWFDQNDEWRLKDLPELPKQPLDDGFVARRVLFDTIGTTLGVTFLLIILRLPWIAFNDTDLDITIITPQNYPSFFPIFIVFVVFYIGIQMVWLKSRRFSPWVFGLRVFHSIALMMVIGVMFFGPSEFLSAESIEAFADILDVDAGRLNQQINLILAAILLGITSLSGWSRFKDYRMLKR